MEEDWNDTKALEYKKLNKQIYFGTQKAIELLKRL